MIEQIDKLVFVSRVAKMGYSRKGVQRYILFVPQEKNDLIEQLIGKQLKVTVQDTI